jgi:hypothetical protein
VWAHPSVLVILALVLLVWDQSYHGRLGVVHAQRAQCVSGVRERFALMEAWYGAAQARQRDASRRHEAAGGADWVAAGTYMDYVRQAMLRATPRFSLTWPDPVAPGVRGPFTHPLGLGHYSCTAAFPAPSAVDFGLR